MVVIFPFTLYYYFRILKHSLSGGSEDEDHNLTDYNEHRLHTALRYQTPEQFKSEWQLSRTARGGRERFLLELISIEDWGEAIMGLLISSIAPDLRKLDKSILDKIHAAIHEINIRNSDRLLIVSHLIDRYIEAWTKIFTDVNEEVLGEITE